ncbi:hypothetical protein HYFRA_00006973 [Hymenoscyphus fraxineus]|uniref:Zn(2)-C6 fungal-type domain-containing protein n=1 Tax=Hymenoscyphus fraxineus TaxID=746836 RepID=A0A9N9KR18_9HELO|nr:hypothetical protein HYFRA_00006973 [Hymenoscyphus fraxineus]
MDSASGATSSHPAPSRVQRGAIATQACETCRQRKQKCDEQRPKCSSCVRMKLECRYREPQPTKKDKTMVEILERLKILESKIDRIPLRPPLPTTGFDPLVSSPSSAPSFNIEPEDTSSSYSSLHRLPPFQPNPSSTSRIPPYRHASAAHKMLTWPAIQRVLIQANPENAEDLKSLEADGSAFVVRVQKEMLSLPQDESLPSQPFEGMQTQETRALGATRVTFPDLTRDVMAELAHSYFDTFNLLYPFMDRVIFVTDILSQVQSEGFGSDTVSVLALLVFALGDLASNAIHGPPIDTYRGRGSGVRGGTALKPPGLALFNEARKRMGFVLTNCDLENVQIFSLAALYFESCSHHLDFWRLTVSASLACQVMITCNEIDWSSQKGDITKRTYWHCVMMETCLNVELDLPTTGIMSFEGDIGMPLFSGPISDKDAHINQNTQFEKHFASQIALRRLCAELHHDINDSVRNISTEQSQEDNYTGPNAASLKRLALRLTEWRSMLPPELQWPENDLMCFPTPQIVSINQMLDPRLSPQQPPRAPLFTANLDDEPAYYPYLYDIHVALLRTRYYYAMYMVYRPFVYKALHYPQHMTTEDQNGAAECLRQMAPNAITDFEEEKDDSISLLLVTKFPWDSHYATYGTT